MSFGFSVGDVIAVGKLIANITNSLNSAGGAKSDYQELVRELESLRSALAHLDRLETTNPSSAKLNSIKAASLSCRYPLEQFLAKVQKYERSLDIRSKPNALRRTTDKLRWTFSSSDEVKRLQSYLNIHIGTINILLAEYGFERMEMAEEKAHNEHLQIRDKLDNTRDLLQQTNNSSVAQALAIQKVKHMLSSLYQVVCGEIKVSLGSLCQAVSQIIVSTQQIHSVVLEIRESMSTVDPRFTYFQAPLIIEDALGLKFPVPSEYDYNMLEVILRHRFKDGIGSSHVSVGNYELFKTKRRNEPILPNTRLLPGTEITMAVIIDISATHDESCPALQCKSSNLYSYPGVGFTCSKRKVWFNQATKKQHALKKHLEAAFPENSQDDLIGKIRRSYPVIAMSYKFMIDNNGDNFKNTKNSKYTKGAIRLNALFLQTLTTVMKLRSSSIKNPRRRRRGKYTTQSSKRSREESEEIPSKGSSGDHHGQQATKRLKIVPSSETSTNALRIRL